MFRSNAFVLFLIYDILSGPGKYHAVNFPLKDGIDDKNYENIFQPVSECYFSRVYYLDRLSVRLWKYINLVPLFFNAELTHYQETDSVVSIYHLKVLCSL